MCSFATYSADFVRINDVFLFIVKFCHVNFKNCMQVLEQKDIF